MQHYIARMIIWGVAVLILIAPLAVGSVEPWAFAIIEAGIFLITGLWLVTRLLHQPDEVKSGVSGYSLVLPAALFLALVGFQMVPLPPSVEAVISPATFQLYWKSLPGWPITYGSGQIATAHPRLKESAVLPTSAEVASGAGIPFFDLRTGKRSAFLAQSSLARRPGILWRPLSVDNALTGPALLKLSAYVCLFLVVVFCPSRDIGKSDVVRILLSMALIAGVLVGAAALLERILSNGKAIWLFAPHDWPRGNPWGSRATGPFANPDHLACFLDLVLPIAVAGLLLPSAFVRQRLVGVRLFCVAAVTLITIVLLLTGSRGAWLGILFGLAIFYTLSPTEARHNLKVGRAALAAGATLGLFVIVVLLGIGPGGRMQTDTRLEETVSKTSIAGRLGPAKASLKMMEDFPALGIGLGCWPELFPRYEKPPWSPMFWNATHNDYVQLAAETGLVGFALLACFFILVIRQVCQGMRLIGPEAAILVAACLAGICSVAVHEFFDFPLQIFANALLFTILLAIAVRLTHHKRSQLLATDHKQNRFLCGVELSAAGALFAAAVTQVKVPYPYNLKPPADLAQAFALENAHPANSRVHLMLARMLSDESVTSRRIHELQAALWLEPINPLARDLYAKTLFDTNNKKEALAEIRRSVYYSPTLDSHEYLQSRILPFLSFQERAAVETGFGRAVAAHYEGALQSFAQYYDELGEFSAEGELHIEAAKAEKDRVRRAAYFVNAGISYAKAKEAEKAGAAFHAAIMAAPQEPAAYEQMMLLVFVPQKNLAAAKVTAAQGIKAGADPFALYIALSSAAQMTGDDRQAEAALEKAAAIRPSNPEPLLRIGEMDLAHNKFDRAADWLQRATRVDPSSAEAFYQLGLADEGAYEYFAADKAYQHTLDLAPTDERFKEHYAAFRQKLAQGKRDTPEP